MKRNGFTLVELLIVIALIGVLAAIAMPRFGSVNGTGEAARCRAQLQSIEIALESYYSENGRYPDPDTEGIDALLEGGYLKQEPACTDANGLPVGTYTWKTDTVTPSVFTYDDNSTTSLAYLGGRAFCSYHGTLDDADWRPNGLTTEIDDGSDDEESTK